MRNLIITATFGCLVTLQLFAGSVDDVRQAETLFAKAFAERDLNRFASFIAPDATFIMAGKGVTGSDGIAKEWAKFLAGESPTPPFSWRSEQAFVDGSGKLAMSIGGVFDPEGKRVATFTSIWRKEAGGWKVVFDGPSAPVCAGKK